MRATKAGSVPARCSAMATAASLAETHTTAFSSAPSSTRSPGRISTVAPPEAAAHSLTITESPSDARPAASSSRTSTSSIILASDAGAREESACCAKSTDPVSASTRIADAQGKGSIESDGSRHSGAPSKFAGLDGGDRARPTGGSCQGERKRHDDERGDRPPHRVTTIFRESCSLPAFKTAK